MSAITASARDEDCTIRLGGICNYDPATTVFAHLNGIRFGKGTGQKVPDLLGAYACSNCHDVVDGRRYTDLPKDFVKLAHLEGMAETQIKLLAKGLIK